VPGRRLLILAAVLLATGAIAAALTPRDLREGGEPAVTAPTAPPRAAGGTRPAAREANLVVDASRRTPARVRVRQGTLVHLVVRAPAPDEVEIVGLQRYAPVDQFAPARFDFFARSGGTFPIRLREADREIGRLLVDPSPL